MKLRCENLVKKYGPRTVVKGVSMEVEQGEIVGFLGPNGAGKTTSFYMITGLITPNNGRIFLDDEEITGLPMFKRAQKGVGYLAQEASVFRHMTVEDNILSVMEMSKQFTKEERLQRLEDLLDEFNLHKVRKSKGIQLSGGERRRCEIARALAIDPKFILLDEPFAGSGGQKQRLAIARALLTNPPILIFDEATSALDPESENIVQTNLRQIAKGRTVLIISHRLSIVSNAEKILVMEHGKLSATGSHRDLMAQPGLYRDFWQQQMSGGMAK